MRIELTGDEALVLFEYLSRAEDGGSPQVGHLGEQVALWRLHGYLEKQLVAPFAADYSEQLSAARERLAGLGAAGVDP